MVGKLWLRIVNNEESEIEEDDKETHVGGKIKHCHG